VGSALYGRLPGLIRCFRQQYPQVQLHLQEDVAPAAAVAA
jgi:DNA-binding transcriptional LysR family regulator